MLSSRRSLVFFAALGSPWLALACGLSPITPPVETSVSTTTGTTGTTDETSTSSTSSNSSGTTTTSASTTTSFTTSSTGLAGSGGMGGSGGMAGTGGQIGSGGGGGSPVDAGPPVCNTTITKYAVDPSPHIPACWPQLYSSNPPTSGPHYPIWAAFKTYTTPVPRGFWVHSLEHGAVVISYNCPAGCDAELASLAAWLDARPADPMCFGGLKSRIIVTPDPELDTRFAASAWGWALRAGCFDLSLLGPFIDAHYGQAPENFCTEGTDVTAPDAGFPADCGHSIPDGG